MACTYLYVYQYVSLCEAARQLLFHVSLTTSQCDLEQQLSTISYFETNNTTFRLVRLHVAHYYRS